jgi:hypothetical protein
MWKGEKLVLAEPTSCVIINGNKYCVDEQPTGNQDGIIDSRSWIVNGEIVSSKIFIDSVTLVATGSPAKQIWKNLLK